MPSMNRFYFVLYSISESFATDIMHQSKIKTFHRIFQCAFYCCNSASRHEGKGVKERTKATLTLAHVNFTGVKAYEF